MKVQEKIDIPNHQDHFIEFGEASWNPNDESIRRRKNRSNGRFDPISSSEIPINCGLADISDLICECLKRDKIGKQGMRDILTDILASANRQGFIVSIL